MRKNESEFKVDELDSTILILKYGRSSGKKNELIAVVDSSASYTDVILLKEWLKQYKSHRDDLTYLLNLLQNLRLDDSQNQFALFQKLINEFLFFLELNPLEKKIVINQKKRVQLETMLEQFQRQESILQNKKCSAR